MDPVIVTVLYGIVVIILGSFYIPILYHYYWVGGPPKV